MARSATATTKLIGLFCAALLSMAAAWTATADAYVYWAGDVATNNTGGFTNVISRANLDGSGVVVEFIRAGAEGVNGVAVTSRHVYWVSQSGIGRANLDGSGVNPRFITGLGFHGAQSYTSLAAGGSHLFFRTSDEVSGACCMGRVGQDGTGGNPNFLGGTDVGGIAANATHVFWTGTPDEDGRLSAIGRANADGTGVNPSFITGISAGSGLAVDANRIYWAQSTGAGADPDGIGRANLDGSGVTPNLIGEQARASGVAVSARHIYWTGPSGDIARANLDGTGVNEQFITGINLALGGPLAVDAGSQPPPVVGRSVSVTVVRGVVLVRRRGQRRFTRLGRQASLPVGSEVDTRRGTVSLTSAAGAGRTQTAEFYDGRFVIRQARARLPVTELALSEPLTCPRRARARAAARSRRLWGKGRGRFRTRGRHAAATVRGTTWLTQDTCASTTVRVTEGSVNVRDFVRRRNVIVRAGRSYTARRR